MQFAVWRYQDVIGTSSKRILHDYKIIDLDKINLKRIDKESTRLFEILSNFSIFVLLCIVLLPVITFIIVFRICAFFVLCIIVSLCYLDFLTYTILLCIKNCSLL